MSRKSSFAPDLLADKVAFVTGGGSGICYGIAQALMQHGAHTVILGRQHARLVSSAAALEAAVPGRRCLPVAADVRSLPALESAVEQTLKEFGKIDLVVCGAAGNFVAPLEGMSSNAFETVQKIDLMGTFNTFKATIGAVTASRGSYLSISATLHYRATPFQAHVSAAKAGVDALTKSIAIEYGPRGVRANIIAPGPIEGTEGMARLVPAEWKDKVTAAIPLQRYGSIEDIADAALFLFSDAAKYVTATTLVVDGGSWHIGSEVGLGPSGQYPKAFLPGAAPHTRPSKL
ncbi:hypothetical protein JCM8097_004821 [Rhodosporidiobolus ruineniae]